MKQDPRGTTGLLSNLGWYLKAASQDTNLTRVTWRQGTQ